MRQRIVTCLLLGLLAGCGVPATTVDQPGSWQPAPTGTTQTVNAAAAAPTPTSATPASAAPTAAALTATAPTASATLAPTSAAANAPLPTTTSMPAAPGTGAFVQGTITYPPDTALPADAAISIRLMPGSRAFFYPEMSEPLGEQRISPVGPGPLPFSIPYDPNAIQSYQSYLLLAELVTGDTVLLTGGAEVITNNQPTEVDIQLHPQPAATAVTGTVSYPEDRQLPPGAVLSIRLQTPVDGVGAPIVLGEQRVGPVGAAPIPFTIPVDASKLNRYAVYSVAALLEAPGRLSWWAHEQPVLTWGAPDRAELALQPPAESKLLSGQITLPEQQALPPEAVLTVQIASVYNDTIGYVEREHVITPVGAAPVAYAIEYTQHSVGQGERYALYAAVRLHEKLLFTSPLVPLNRAALPATLDLQLERPAQLGTVRGTLRLAPERPLPADASLVVQLADTSAVYSDGEPIVFATQTIAPVTGGQQHFAIEYDPRAIASGGRYSVYAELRSRAGLLYASEWHDVITAGQPTEVELTLRPTP